MDRHAAQQNVVMEGYLLKKKRKKIQGMGRRYFRLSSTGALSYAFNPNSPIRDSIFVSLAFISANRKHRTLDIDGGNTVYHCKALTLEDFDRWAGALRQFIDVAQDQANSAAPVEQADGGYVGGLPSAVNSPDLAGGALDGEVERQKVLDELAKIKQPLRDLELIAQGFRHAESQPHVPSPAQLSASPSVNGFGNGNANGGSKFRGFLGKRSNSTSQPHPPSLLNSHRSVSFSAASSSSNGPPTLPPIPGIPTTNEPQPLPPSFSPTSPDSSYFDARSSFSGTPPNDLLLRQLQSAIASLKLHHDQLTAAVHALPRSPPPHPYFGHDRPLSPLGSPHITRSHSALGFHPGHTRNAPSRASSSRASFTSFFSATEGDDWQDTIPGEFVLAEEEESSREGSQAPSPDRRRRESEISEGESTIAEFESEGEDYDSGEETEEEFVDGQDEDDRATISGEASSSGSALASGMQVQRRQQLPSPVAGDEFSLLGMLRKNVGKDLSTISLPVTANEPLSLLQRMAEELEYSDLLDRAAATKDPIERLTLVAVFAVSGTAGNKYRTSRKPFNPLLGETYECIRPEKGFQFISEKVSHHPPILAFHGEAPQKGWEVYGHLAPSQKFWGRSMEVFVHGDYMVRFADGEVFSIRKPSSFVRNLVAGTKYLEVVGDLVVTTTSSSAQAVISFKEGSTWGGSASRNKVEGRIVGADGNAAAELVGRWDDAVDKREGKNNFTRLWQVSEFPPNPERYYGFSHFAVTLNELTPLEEGQLAPSDSRLRPDQLAFERGDVDEAERLKALVEEKQRAKRKEGRVAEPKWFTKEGEQWKYGGQYFDAREKKAFEDPDIFVSP
ncbi:hypothetical protein JCM10213_003177 [Rhodosporidiobolus nylandii]